MNQQQEKHKCVKKGLVILNTKKSVTINCVTTTDCTSTFFGKCSTFCVWKNTRRNFLDKNIVNCILKMKQSISKSYHHSNVVNSSNNFRIKIDTLLIIKLVTLSYAVLLLLNLFCNCSIKVVLVVQNCV